MKVNIAFEIINFCKINQQGCVIVPHRLFIG